MNFTLFSVSLSELLKMNDLILTEADRRLVVTLSFCSAFDILCEGRYWLEFSLGTFLITADCRFLSLVCYFKVGNYQIFKVGNYQIPISIIAVFIIGTDYHSDNRFEISCQLLSGLNRSFSVSLTELTDKIRFQIFYH